MSDRHREALTHLSYGLGGVNSGHVNSEGTGGFVLLTGEVGTGKTTVSRCLMADLPDNTQLAFILNPTLSSQELLATICDQLKVRYRKTGATLKTLTDKISEKLLKNHANGINTLLIIDEAQHLEPEVLEQLRLLTNLETNTKKLLQVILIGQPELQQLLKRRDLRQLAQRITARYHLLPLNQQELSAYIKHRLSVADCHRALFNKGALLAIHKLSQGVPRLINLICHSALMEAYNSNNAVVDKKIVHKAACHALGDDFEQLNWWQHKQVKISAAASLLLLVLFSGYWLGQGAQVEVIQPKVVQVTPQVIQPAKIDVPMAAANNTPLMQTQTVIASEGIPLEIKEKLPQKKSEQKVVLTSAPVEKIPDNISVTAERVDKVSAGQNEQQSDLVAKEEPYQLAAVDGVSENLLARFQAALDDTESLDASPAEPAQAINSEVPPLSKMPAWVQKGIPSLTFEQHIYISDGQGWVNVNGREQYEGDIVADGLNIEKILPQQVIMTYRGETFSLPALTNW